MNSSERHPEITLAEYMKGAWSEIDPEPLIWNWHIDAILEHLAAVSLGLIRNLVINMPPRFGKSTDVAVVWPTWEWTWRAKTRWMFASYAAELSLRDSLNCRRLIDSVWYQSNFGREFQIRPDKDTRIKFENDRGGYRLATSVGGTATGEGGDRIVVDDPLKADEGDSQKVRDLANSWYKETMTTRRNNLKTGSRVIVMQRLHEMDLTGFVLSEAPERWEALILPMEYEPFRDRTGVEIDKPVTSIGFSDPRSEEGELLDPKRVGPNEIEELQQDLGEYGTAGQLQQHPAPRGGGTLKREWFENHIRACPAKWAPRVRYWDKAASEGARSSRTAGTLMARDLTTGAFYIEDIIKGRWATQEREEIIKRTAKEDGPEVLIWIEQEPGSGGKDSAFATVRNLAGYVVCIDRVTGDKTARAKPLATQASVGNVWTAPGEWNEDFFTEAALFPRGRFTDQIDTVAGALVKLAEGEPWDDASAGERPKAVVR